MSMIDCKVNVTKKQDPKGDRVVLTFECVLFLPVCIDINARFGHSQWEVFALFQVVKTVR
jgi:hypothetical protein